MRKKKIISETILPDSKFHKDDIIKIPNKSNKKKLYIRISKVIYFGDTIHCEECGQTFTTMKGYRYEGIIQFDSFDDTVATNPIRPGLAKLFSSDIEQFQKLNHFQFTPIDGDNPLNIQQREKEWRSKVSTLRGK